MAIREIDIDELNRCTARSACWSKTIVDEFLESGFAACEVEDVDDAKRVCSRLRNYIAYNKIEGIIVIRRKGKVYLVRK